MTTNKHEKGLIVIQLTGGNDYLNTVVPYGDGRYYDSRPKVHIPQDKVIPLNDDIGFNPSMGPMKALWDEGKVAVINGVGYENPNRSHFRSMDIWHTAEPEKIASEGWLGRVIREMDPARENVLTGVNFGRGLPRSLGCEGVPVASVGDLASYGLFPDVEDEALRVYALEAFSRMYGRAEAGEAVMQHLGRTGNNALKGADILRTAPEKYTSSVEYAASPIAQSLRSAAQVLCADLGTRVYYTQHGCFDTHAAALTSPGQLWKEVSEAVADVSDDLAEHGRDDEVVILMFSEFGRRIQDNGSGTDHGSGGVSLVIGGQVEGGLYGEYPSLAERDQLEGDLRANNDFRSTYSTLLEGWLGMVAAPIVNGDFEQFEFISN